MQPKSNVLHTPPLTCQRIICKAVPSRNITVQQRRRVHLREPTASLCHHTQLVCLTKPMIALGSSAQVGTHRHWKNQRKSSLVSSSTAWHVTTTYGRT